MRKGQLQRLALSRSLHLLGILFLLGLLPMAGIQAQNVNVSGALVGNGTYATLGAAFTAINGGAQTGATIVVDIVNNTTEGTASLVLNQSSGPWASLLIRPQGGAWTVTAATTAGSPMIDLNGADNVTIDGLNASGNALTIQNTTASATSGTSTIRFQTDATGNTITNCAIQGSASMTAGTNGGTIWFGAAAVTTGNDNNIISNCDIGPAGTNLPSKAIYANGSTTTTTVYNSGNQILNCRIFDYFNATVTSMGIYAAAGNSDWTISGNRFYQTAARTQTTGTVHAAIQLASTNINNFTISSNIIGFATAAGTGTYTLTGASGGKMYPIYLSSHGTTTATNITGNTVTNINYSGNVSGTSSSAPLIAIFISSGLANANNNILGSSSANGAISFTSSSTGSSEVYGIYNFSTSNTTLNGNSIGGFTVTNVGAPQVSLIAIRVNTSATATTNVQNNQIGGTVVSSMQSTQASATTNQVIGILISLSNATVTGNTIVSLSALSGNGTGSTPAVAGIVVNASGSNHTVAGNIISSIGSLSPVSTGQVVGISFNATTGANLVTKNIIHSLVVQSAGATMNGINILGGTATYSNNMIRLGIDPTGAALAMGCTINGINETTAGTDNIYHNSVYIGGSGVGGTANTFAFQSSITTNARNYINNIFQNARSNGAGTGKHYAIRVGGTAPNPTGLTSNGNVLFANGTGGVLGLYNAVDQATISAWRSATGQDNNSFSADPVFNNATGPANLVDLHVGLAPTPIESAGQPLAAVTDDVDGQTRASFTPTDIGADAGNFVAVDLGSPSITYTLLPFTCSTGDRVLTATITDYTGVPTTGLLVPRIYYRKNAGAYVSAAGTLTSGTATNGTWDFTISAAALGGLVVGDAVSYFVIAQDVATPTFNIGSNPGGGLVATDVNTVTTPPTTPNSYSINNTLSGTYTVGATGNFTTLTAAVAAYNNGCLGGPVLFSLIDATYPGETFPITITANPYSSSTNTLTIKPAIAGVTLTGSSATSILNLNGADFVTIDGSVGTTANTICPLSAASRDLTISNTNTSTASGVVWLSSTLGGDQVNNVEVKNCIISGNASNTTLIALGAGANTIGSPGGPHTNLSFVNNALRAASFGIYASGAAATAKSQNIVVNQNDATGSGTASIGQTAITVVNVNNGTISGNVIDNIVNSTTVQDPIGINAGMGVVNGISTTAAGIADGVSNITITHNKIGTVASTSTYSAAGIAFGPTASGTSLIANNMIYGVSANGTAGDFCGGIVLAGGNTATLNIFHNTVSMQGVMGGATAGTQVSACLAITTTTASTGVNVRNNIFTNTQVGNASSTTKFVTIGYHASAPFTGISSNYNDLISAGAGPGTYFTGITGGLVAGTTATTLANWQTATSGDANSVAVAPVFTSATDLHLPLASNGGLNNIGTPIAVTTDIDCETRGTTPDLGADEMPNICVAAEAGTAAGSATFCISGSATLTATGFSTGTGSTYNWQSSPAGANTWTNTGGTNPASFATGTVTASTDFRLFVACATNSSVDSSNVVTITITPGVAPSVSIAANPGTSICAGTSVTFTATPTNGGAAPSYAWFKNATPVGTNSATYTDAGLANGDIITCTLTSNDPCASPTTANSNALTMVVTALVTPSVSIAANPGTTICAGTSVTFTATPTNGGAAPSYAWFKNAAPVGTNSATYTDAGLVNGDVITCTLTSNALCASPTTANSNTLTMVVNATVTPSVTISANPGTTVCNGLSVTFTATPTNGGAAPSYAWFKNATPVGTNSATYTDAGLVNGDVITCTLTSNALCASPTTASSNSLTMTVTANLTPSVSIAANPGVNICAGTSVTFTATPTNGGASPSYAWFKNATPVGANSATYTDAGLANGDVITCTLTSNDPCASPTTASSNALTIAVVTNTTPVVTISVSPGATICPGGSATFTASASNAGSTPSYAWLLNGSPVGTNSTTYTNGSLTTGDIVYCVVTSSDACASPTTDTSNVITMTVGDVTAPIAVCQSLNVTLNGSGNATIVAAQVNNGSSDNCTSSGSLGLSLSTASFTCANVGSNTVTLTVTDGAGNTATCTGTVMVSDTTHPTISCPTNISANTGSGTCAAVVTYTTPSGSDNCSATVAQTAGLASGASFPLGVTTNTFRATDGAGNTATCSFTVTVTDTELPSITCPANVSANTGTGTCAAVVTYTAPTGSDNCSGSTTTQTAGLASGASFPLGVTTNTFRVTDGAGNSATCSFTVTVTDNQLPSITCPANQSVNASVGVCTAAVTYTAPVGTDNCSGATTAQTAGLASGASFPLGVTTNTFRATDGAGNTATCSFTVTVTDNQLPSITCPANQSVNAGVGVCTATVTYTAPVGTDNCSGATTAQTAGLASGASFPLGVTTNTFRATDGAGNTATCSFTVTVTDNQLPSITCPANQSVNAGVGVCTATVTYTAPVGTDNCSGATTAQTAGLASGASFPLGVTTNTFRATDGAGNTATCSFTVTVIDNQLPTITCPANISANTGSSSCDAVVTYTAPVGTDNCSGATTVQTAGLASGGTFPLGVTTNAFLATDGAGNTATCSFTVTVTDNVLPSITCPANITATTGTGCAAVVTWTAPTATDNCSGATAAGSHTPGSTFSIGTTTVTYTATDAATNTSTCSFTITVADNTAPVAQCQAATVTLVSGTGTLATSDVDAGSSDECGVQGLNLSQTTFSCADAGTQVVTLTVTDVNGNTSTCTANVTVVSSSVATATVPATTACGFGVSCNGGSDGSATTTPNGGCSPYTYLWSNGDTGGTATGLNAGVHYVTVTDAGGATTVDSVTITEPTALSSSLVSTGGSCVGDSTGSADITVAGGNDCQPYTFLWSNGATTEDLTGVAGGTYTVTITDVAGCTSTLTVTVPSFPVPTPTIIANQNVITSIQPWVTYQWLLNGSTIPGATNNSYTASVTGVYSLMVTDSNGCSAVSDTLTVIGVGVLDPGAGMDMVLFPNPARGQCVLRTMQPVTDALTVEVHDMYGKRQAVYALPALNDDLAIDLSRLTAGTYMVNVRTSAGAFKQFKLVVQ